METIDREIYLELMTEAYLECASWASTHHDEETGRDTPLDDIEADWSEKAKTEAKKDCEDFFDANASDLANMQPSQAGHDFWLTRNGHGAGFWDRGLGALGERLTKSAKVWGSCDAYLGDDKKIYLS